MNEGGRIFVEALATIEPGTELLYDYAYARTPDNDNPESEGLYACRCGAPNCRGSILEPRRKTPARRKSAAKRATVAKRDAKKAGAKKAGAKKAGAKKAGAQKRVSTQQRPVQKRGAAGRPPAAKRTRAKTATRR